MSVSQNSPINSGGSLAVIDQPHLFRALLEEARQFRNSAESNLNRAKLLESICDRLPRDGEWKDVHDVKLDDGEYYIVRRRFSGREPSQPALARWSVAGWWVLFGVIPMGCSLDRLEVYSANA